MTSTKLTNAWYFLCRVFFQHDNAPRHKSTSTASFLKDLNVAILDWSANFPDTNPIEKLWHVIKNKINALGLHNTDELWKEIQII